MHSHLSTDIIQLIDQLKKQNYKTVIDFPNEEQNFSIKWLNGEIVLFIQTENQHFIVHRLYPLHQIDDADVDKIKVNKKKPNQYEFDLRTAVGSLTISITIIENSNNLFLLNTQITLKVSKEHRFKKPDREIVIGKEDYSKPDEPTINVHQIEGRTGHCFTDFGNRSRGYLFYLQDLGALQKMAEHSEVSFMDTVKVEWPQVGFKLGKTKSTLQQGGEYIVYNSFLGYSKEKDKSPLKASSVYLQFLKSAYPNLQKPRKSITDIVDLSSKVTHDLWEHKGCWKQVEDAAYLNAYLNSYGNPPESMVQLAILRPLFEYQKNFGNDHTFKIIRDLTQNLPHFFDEQLDIIHRWLPADSYLLNFDEEQKRSFIMDSWYLLYPLLQLASLFELGFKNEELQNQFERSLRYIQKAAKHFEYEWPIFFNLYTLEILKEEGIPNEYGEIDTAGLYILIMLKSYKLFKKEVYLTEAKRAAKPLKDINLESIYQSNNTAYSAEALLELYTLTQNEQYLQSAEIFLGNIIRNCAIWEMKYGNAKERESFFSLLPLKKAPYIAAFEEHETVAIFHRIIKLIDQNQISLNLDLVFFLNEFIQYALLRFTSYFPPTLPDEVFADEAKTGYVNPKLWIPIEDLGDGWEALGQVGQEVYGSSVFFNLCIHHVVHLSEDNYMISSLPFIQNRAKEIKILGTTDQEGLLWLKEKNITVEINNQKLEEKKQYQIKGSDNIKFISKR